MLPPPRRRRDGSPPRSSRPSCRTPPPPPGTPWFWRRNSRPGAATRTSPGRAPGVPSDFASTVPPAPRRVPPPPRAASPRRTPCPRRRPRTGEPQAAPAPPRGRGPGREGSRSGPGIRARPRPPRSCPSGRPGSGRSPACGSPLCARRLPVRLHDRAVDEHPFGAGPLRQGIGRSRHGDPVRNRTGTASTKRRLSAAVAPGSVALPGGMGSIRTHMASVSTVLSASIMSPARLPVPPFRRASRLDNRGRAESQPNCQQALETRVCKFALSMSFGSTFASSFFSLLLASPQSNVCITDHYPPFQMAMDTHSLTLTFRKTYLIF